jgi:hypothetical protein
LKQLGISVYAPAKVLGISLRQAQRHSFGEAPAPPLIAKLPPWWNNPNQALWRAFA